MRQNEYVVGWEVVKVLPHAIKPTRLSKLFTIRSAAEDFLRLAKPEHPDAYLREIVRRQGVGIRIS